MSDATSEVEMAGKRCPRCKKIKQVEAFGVDRNRPTGLATYCKSCAAARSKAQYEKRKRRNDKLSEAEIYARAREKFGG